MAGGLRALNDRKQRGAGGGGSEGGTGERRERNVDEPRNPKPPAPANTSDAEGEQRREFAYLPIEDIIVNPENPDDRYEGEDFDNLVESLREAGQEQAISVVPRRLYLTVYPQHRKAIGAIPYVAIMGCRRTKAAPIAGLTRLAAWIKYDLEDEEGFTAAAFIENFHRVPFKPVQEGRAFALLLKKYGTQTAVARALGVSQPLISQRIGLVANLLPDLADAVDDGLVLIGEARVLAKQSPAEQQAHLDQVLLDLVPAQPGPEAGEMDERASREGASASEPGDGDNSDPDEASIDQGNSQGGQRAKTKASPTATRRAAARETVAAAATGRIRLTIDPEDPAEILEKLREKVTPDVMGQLALLLGAPADSTS